MKRAAAIILSLTLIWLQAGASAQTTSAPAAAQCGCCSGKRACCCIEESTPVSSPLAATPVSASAQIDFTAILTKVMAWTLPAAAPAIVSSPDTSSSSLAVPLFQRDCALLI